MNQLIKLVIRGEEAAIKTVAKLEKIVELKKKGVIVAFKATQTVENNNREPFVKMTYKERLFQELDSESIFWFNKIFS